MKKTIPFLSITLSIVLLFSFTNPVFAAQSQESNDNYPIIVNYVKEKSDVIYLDNGDMIETITYIHSNSKLKALSTIVTKSQWTKYTNSKGDVLASFTIYGDFKTATGECVNSYHDTFTSGGSWRVEDVNVRRSTYAVDGSCNFVQRILGIKTESINRNLHLTY